MILFLSNYFPIFAPAKYEDMQNSNVTTVKLMGLAALAAVLVSCNRKADAPIDRVALLERNNPVVTAIDTMASLTVGNGDFAMTVDVTGLQTFPEKYSKGVPLGTMSSCLTIQRSTTRRKYLLPTTSARVARRHSTHSR